MLDSLLVLATQNLRVIEIPDLPPDTILVGSELFKRMQEAVPAQQKDPTLSGRAACALGFHQTEPNNVPYQHACVRPGCGVVAYMGP